MSIVQRISEYRADWIDVGLTKVAVFFATLWLAKIWSPILAWDWSWYLALWIIAAIKPLVTFFRWFRKGS